MARRGEGMKSQRPVREINLETKEVVTHSSISSAALKWNLKTVDVRSCAYMGRLCVCRMYSEQMCI